MNKKLLYILILMTLVFINISQANAESIFAGTKLKVQNTYAKLTEPKNLRDEKIQEIKQQKKDAIDPINTQIKSKYKEMFEVKKSKVSSTEKDARIARLQAEITNLKTAKEATATFFDTQIKALK